MHQAKFYQRNSDNSITCELCPHSCHIKPGGRGICRLRENNEGILYSLSYGKLLSAAIDPIEKKPLYHYLPGSHAFSICTAGCNLGCQFCQNSDISQLYKYADESLNPSVFSESVPPQKVVALAKQKNCDSIAYTYTEPTIFYEYALDIAKLAHGEGVKNIFVTNGFIQKEPVKAIAPYLDAANIDLKSFSDDYYRQICAARLQPVLDTIKLMYELNIHIELTTLIITGKNDSTQELEALTRWIAELDRNIPWHVSAFHPAYKMQDIPRTAADNIYKAIEIGKQAGLNYVYAGNIGVDRYQDTLCPICQHVLIERSGYLISNKLKTNACPSCQHPIPITL